MALILIVDGDPDVVQAGKIVLEREGHRVLTAPDLETGVTLLERRQPDLMLLDCMLGERGGGLRAARMIRSRGFSLPILMLSVEGRSAEICAYQDDDLVEVGRFPEKPMDPGALSKSVKLLLEGGEEASCFWPRPDS